MRQRYFRFCDGLLAVTRPIVMALMGLMTVNVLLGVFFRYVVGDALTWTEESSRYLMIWMGFLATALALREGGHVAMDLLSSRLPPSARKAMFIFVQLLCLVYLLSVVVMGAVLLAGVRAQRTPVLAISMMWPYLAIPVGCLLTALETVALMLKGEKAERGAPDIGTMIEDGMVGKPCS